MFRIKPAPMVYRFIILWNNVYHAHLFALLASTLYDDLVA
jgi:hypothetical protein